MAGDLSADRTGHRQRARELLAEMRLVTARAAEAYSRAGEAFLEIQHRHAAGLRGGEALRTLSDSARAVEDARAELITLARELHRVHVDAGTRSDH